MNTPKETPRIDAEFETIMQHHTRKKGKGGQVVSWQCAFRDAKQIARQLELELQTARGEIEKFKSVAVPINFTFCPRCGCQMDPDFDTSKDSWSAVKQELTTLRESVSQYRREVEGLIKFVQSLPCKCEDVFNREDHFIYTHKCERCKTLDSAMKEQGK